jgi:hypothetical protein
MVTFDCWTKTSYSGIGQWSNKRFQRRSIAERAAVLTLPASLASFVFAACL